jgi:glycosyltransferase involved in cell wall biosynthesis
MKKKTLIAQDFGVYKELIEDGVTGILVNKNDKGWYKAMRKVILDKEYREELAQNLHEYVIKKYDIKNVTEKRVEFYKMILTEKPIILADIIQKGSDITVNRPY